jgi:hypothetical protein
MLPDYLNDLNAMHEAEQHPRILEDDTYLENLSTVVSGKKCHKVSEANPWEFCSASASQRAEAFLETINQKTK